MDKARIFDFLLFFTAIYIAFTEQLLIETDMFVKALFIYWLFSSLYSRLRVYNKSGNTNFDYGISYSFSISIFTGPLGLFIFESLFRFTVYLIRKKTKTADPGEFSDMIYNIGSFVVTNSIGYYLFFYFYPKVENLPFGYWILICLLVTFTSYLSSIMLTIFLLINGDLKTSKEAVPFITKNRSLLDIGKVALTNGLLYLFLIEGNWEMLISLFMLNYIVSHSFTSKAQNIQDKIERNKFEQMAYTDFLTGIYNRAFMDKKMNEINQGSELIGIVVCDIDNFKRINDNYNHAVGDRVIKDFAETLHSYLNENDFLFRSGGEEFTFFLRKRNFNQCEYLTETIRQVVENKTLQVEFHSEPVPLSYTVSFGLYFFKITEKLTMERGYVLADHLLLKSKQLGRNRVSVENGLLNE